MDWKLTGGKITEVLKKYRYACLVVLVGLALMAFPERRQQEPKPDAPVREVEPCVEERLEKILEQVDGAGIVEVFLTESRGARTIYQTDEDRGELSERKKTVILSGNQRQEQGLVRGTDPPLWQGAIVVCQGAEDPSVRLAVVDAVRCVTGLGADRISVLKMK